MVSLPGRDPIPGPPPPPIDPIMVGGCITGAVVGCFVGAAVEEEAKKLDENNGSGNTLRAVSGAIGAVTAAVAISYPLAGWGFFFTAAFATGGIIVASFAVMGLAGWF